MSQTAAFEFKIQVYVGKSQSGKTSLALFHSRGRRRVLIHDPNGEAQNAHGAHIVTAKEHLLALIDQPGPVRICWRGEMSDAFDFANRCAWAGENFDVVWDEADKLTRARLEPGSAAYDIVHSGRHRGLRLFATTRRPARVPRDITAGATRICCARLQGGPDLKYMHDFVGDASRLIPTLGKYEFLDWIDDVMTEPAVKKSYFL